MTKTIIVLILALSLAIQGLTIGAMAYGVTIFISLDVNSPSSPTQMQQNSGYIIYILLASGASVLIYIYLLIVKIIDKPSSLVTWILYLTVLLFQFGVAMLYSVLLKNNSVTFDSVEAGYTLATSFGVTSSLITNYGQLIVFRKLCMASAIIGFLITFLGTSFAFAKYTEDAKVNSPSVGTEAKKQTSITELR